MTLFIYKFEFILHNTQTEVHKSDSITVSQELHCLLSIGFEFILFWETIFILARRNIYIIPFILALYIYIVTIFFYKLKWQIWNVIMKVDWGGGGSSNVTQQTLLIYNLLKLKSIFTRLFFIFMHYENSKENQNFRVHVGYFQCIVFKYRPIYIRVLISVNRVCVEKIKTFLFVCIDFTVWKIWFQDSYSQEGINILSKWELFSTIQQKVIVNGWKSIVIRAALYFKFKKTLRQEQFVIKMTGDSMCKICCFDWINET